MDTTEQTEFRELTLKQRKWLDIYLQCGNATEAAMQVYDCKDRESAANVGYENVRKLDYTDFLEAAGVTDNLLQQKILEGLEATKVISAKIIVSKDKPTSQASGELPPATSQTDDFIDVPDFMARHKYLETVLKLKKRLVERQEITGQNGQPIQYRIITGTGFIPAGVIIDATPAAGDTGGQQPIQNPSLAPQGT